MNDSLCELCYIHVDVCSELPSNQSFYRLIAGEGKGVGHHTSL